MPPTPIAPQRGLSPLILNIVVAAFILALHNNTFWARSYAAYEGSLVTMALFGGAAFALTLLIITLFALRWFQKPVLVFLLILTAVTSYYQDTLGATINRDMIQNAITTTYTESKHLVTAGFLFHVLWAGILPAAFVLYVPVKRSPLLRAGMIWGASVVGTVVMCIGLLLVDFSTFSVVLRGNKTLMAAYQPGAPLSGTFNYAKMVLKSKQQPLQAYGLDAKTGEEVASAKKPILMVLIAGETARSASWSLNGYERQTTPELAKRDDIINFTNISSCGTATAVSLPCMFSPLTRKEYSYEGGLATENLLDVMGRAGYKVEWWDNNTGDKGIAARFGVNFIINSTDPRYCANGECTDGIFFDALANYAENLTENTVLVLHMIGSHGPAYYLRYPKEYEAFTPTCDTSALKDCTVEEITNTYENTILYTDFSLSRMINILETQDKVLPALLYISDHGESMGENGLYLHGAPYMLAPDTQTRVPMVLWMGPQYADTLKIDANCIRAKKDVAASHDNLFSTVLRLGGVQSETVVPALDLTAGCHTNDN